MTSEDLLDGKAGPEAQANEVLRLVNLDMAAAIKEVQLAAGDDATITGSGYPFITIGRASS
jgi:hypothetical protein